APAGILEPCRVVDETARGFDLGLHVGDHPLNGLKVGDGFAEGAALLGVLDGFFQRALREADSLRGNADASAIERAERDFESLTFFSEAIFCGDFAVVENDFDRGRRVLAHFFFVAPAPEALEPLLAEDAFHFFLPAAGRAPTSPRLRIGLGKDQENAGDAAVRYPSLRAVELVAAGVVAGGARLNACGVGTGL